MPRYKFGDLVYNITEKRSPVAGDEDFYIGLEHLDSGSLKVSRWGSKVALKGDKLIMRKGDILFGRRNTYLRRVAISPHDGLFSAHGMIFRAKTERISSDYLPFFLASDYFMSEAIRISVGSLSPTVNWKELKELDFCIPNIEEQNEIVKPLIEANNLKEKYEELLVQTDELVKSQFIGMFGNEDFPTCKLIDECVVITKGTTPTTIGFNFTDAGVNFVKIENITAEGKFIADGMMYISEKCNEAMKRSQLKIGDILFSIAGAIGRSAIVTDEILPANINQALAIVRLKEDTKFIKGFLLAALKSEYVEKQYLALKRGAAQLNLSLKDVGNFTIPIPPVEMQESFVTLYEQSDKSKLIGIYNKKYRKIRRKPDVYRI